jgi:hypothetical protein
MESDTRALGSLPGQFEAWAANLEIPDGPETQAQSGKTLCSVVLSKEGEPHKLYEVAAVLFGDEDALSQKQFVKVGCKTAGGSPGNAPHVSVVVHASLVCAGCAYSEAVLKNPEAATHFMPEKVLLTPPDKFDKLDRVFVTKLEPPTAWVSYSAQLAKKSLGSPAAKPIRKVKAKEKSAGTSKRARSPADSTASSQSD